MLETTGYSPMLKALSPVSWVVSSMLRPAIVPVAARGYALEQKACQAHPSFERRCPAGRADTDGSGGRNVVTDGDRYRTVHHCCSGSPFCRKTMDRPTFISYAPFRHPHDEVTEP